MQSFSKTATACARPRRTPRKAAGPLDDPIARIREALLILTGQGGAGNFMIVSCGDFYVQFLGRRGDPEVECEVWLPALPETTEVVARRWLSEAGFANRDEPGCFARVLSLAGERVARDVARGTVLLFRNIGGVADPALLQVKVVLE